MVSGHPFILSKYKKINYHEVDNIFFLNYILKILYNFIKIKFHLIKILFTKNFSNIDKNFYNGTLVVSHLINSENFYKGVDVQYGGIEKSNKNIKKIYFYIKNIGFKNKLKTNLSKNRKNFFINNFCTSLKEYIKITYFLFKEFIFLTNKIKKSKSNFEKKFYLECSKYLFSLSTIKNVILYNNLSNLFRKK